MATYRILYWQDIPSQVQAEDSSDTVNLPMGDDFEKRIDKKATELGLVGTDEYLDQWSWGEERDLPGTASEVAERVRQDLLERAGMG